MPNQSLFARLGYILLGALLLHLLWATLSLVMQKALLPTPWAVYAHMPTAWQEGMAGHLMASLGRIGVGLALALLIALIIALAMHRYRHFGKVFDAFIYFSYPIPKLALLPIVMLLGGLGESTKIIMILLIVLFQLIVSLRDALAAIPKDNYIVPALLSALRIAIGTAVSVLFVTETYGTSRGMGYYIVNAWMRVDYLDMYAGIAFLGATGFLLFVLTDCAEYLLAPWRRAQ